MADPNNSDGVPRPRVLLVDDETEFIQRSTRLLAGEYELEAAADWPSAKKLLDRKSYDAVLLDFDLKDGLDGLDIIEKLRKTGPLSLAIVLISKFMREDLENSGYQKGADHCMSKELSDEKMKREISNAIRRNLEKRELIARAREERDSAVSPTFKSKAMRSVLDRLAGFIKTNENILITGEKGTGKGVLAKWIHRNSGRQGMILTHIHIPCLQEELLNAELFGHMKGAFPGADEMPGLLEISQNGTMILDEIAELKLEHQSKLLGMMQERTFRRVRGVVDIQFDVRFISLTNHPDLDMEAREGKFRGDLLDRLRKCHIQMPPLRERREDIPEIAADLLAHLKKEHNRPDVEGFDDALMNRMIEYAWPGNVRELEIWIDSGVLNSYGSHIKIRDVERSVKTDRVQSGKIPLEGEWKSMTLDEVTDHARRMLVEHVLTETGGTMNVAANRLGVHRVNLYKICSKLGIDHAHYGKKQKKD